MAESVLSLTCSAAAEQHYRSTETRERELALASAKPQNLTGWAFTLGEFALMTRGRHQAERVCCKWMDCRQPIGNLVSGIRLALDRNVTQWHFRGRDTTQQCIGSRPIRRRHGYGTCVPSKARTAMHSALGSPRRKSVRLARPSSQPAKPLANDPDRQLVHDLASIRGFDDDLRHDVAAIIGCKIRQVPLSLLQVPRGYPARRGSTGEAFFAFRTKKFGETF